jgi:hypothetical protein
MPVNVTGIAWYRREDYERLKEMFPDGDTLAYTYDDWLKTAQDLYDRLTKAGDIPVKAEIDPETFPEWCRARGMEMDGKARVAYGVACAAVKVRKLKAYNKHKRLRR